MGLHNNTATPVAVPVSGTIAKGTTITLTTATDGATIWKNRHECLIRKELSHIENSSLSYPPPTLRLEVWVLPKARVS